MDNIRRIALLGSTGSIGEQTLDVVRESGGILEITTLTAKQNWQRLAQQAVEFQPDSVVIADKEHYNDLKQALAQFPIKVYAGAEALSQIVQNSEIDIVVNALVGYSGMEPTVAAIEAGKAVALANKESLVVAGDLVMRKMIDNKGAILPIDSEHSAVFQCIVGEKSPIDRIILTASGGPFRNTPKKDFEKITVAQAMKHPNWNMGAKITIDSATMLNKGFEVIEARWLFDVDPSRIEVVVHPQSIVHSMVEFLDGSIKAQMGLADMRLPIQYALYFPHRMATSRERFSFTKYPQLDFLPVDRDKFPCLDFAYQCLKRGGNSGCILNGANEVAVAAFLMGEIPFTDIPKLIEITLAKASFKASPSFDDYRLSNTEAREIATSFLRR